MTIAPLLSALLAVASPEIRLAPAAARPGDAVLVRVLGAGAQAPVGTLAGRPLGFWRGRKEWRAFCPLPMELTAGTVRAEVHVGAATTEAPLEIVEPGFSARALAVAGKYVEPPSADAARIAADRGAFEAAYTRELEPPLFKAGFGWPRRARTTGRFGDQRTLNGKKGSVHYGLDITGPRGSPIAASNDGVVAIARDAYMSGKTVVLWHGAGVFTLYFHLDRIDVRTGDRVKRGQRIGRLGSTGRSTGPHLHWAARVDGLLVDPESLLRMDLARGTAPPRAPARLAPAAPAPPTPAEIPPAATPADPAAAPGPPAAAAPPGPVR
jgi:murein DD-endopeptidase MepM/ murein hydrolase activator NlpD